MKNISSLLTLLLVLGLSPLAKAQIFTADSFSDNFTRANVASTNNGSLLGTGYVIASSSVANQAADKWELNNNTVQDANPAHNDFLLQENFTLTSSFTISTTFIPANLSGGGVATGLAFDVTNATVNLSGEPGYIVYVTGSGSLKLIDANNNTLFSVADTTTGIVPTLNTPITLTLTSTGNYTFDITESSGTTTYDTGTILDNGGIGNSDSYTNGGYAGLFTGADASTFSSLTITNDVAPEPSTIALMLAGGCLLVGTGVMRRRQIGI